MALLLAASAAGGAVVWKYLQGKIAGLEDSLSKALGSDRLHPPSNQTNPTKSNQTKLN